MCERPSWTSSLDGETLAFVEVRTRRGGESGLAALSVNGRKAAKLRLAAQWYIDAHPEFDDRALRVDVITVELDARGVVREVAHIEDAVRG